MKLKKTMILLCLAHRGEAQSFIKYLKLSSNLENINFYTSTNISLLITGEGSYEVLTTLPYIIAKVNPKKIINYGIAGSLNQSINVDSIYSIRTAYSFGTKPRFESFTLKSSNLVDCITTDERVLEDKYSEILANFAQIVDRELWAIAKVAKKFKIPLKSYKLISDQAGNETNCFDLKARAKDFSDKMCKHFIENKEDLEISQEREYIEIELPFRVSFTQKKRIEKLFPKLKNSQRLIKEYIKSIENTKYQHKDTANNFISFLEHKINPINKSIDTNFKNEIKCLEECGVKVIYDKKLDTKKITINFEINSQKNVEKLTEALKKLNFQNIDDIWNGKFNV